MAPLYTREPPSPRDCVRRTIVQVRRPSLQPALTCSGLEVRASRAFLRHRSSRVSSLCQAGRPLLLAAAGGEPPDSTPVRGDAPADLGGPPSPLVRISAQPTRVEGVAVMNQLARGPQEAVTSRPDAVPPRARRLQRSWARPWARRFSASGSPPARASPLQTTSPKLLAPGSPSPRSGLHMVQLWWAQVSRRLLSQPGGARLWIFASKPRPVQCGTHCGPGVQFTTSSSSSSFDVFVSCQACFEQPVVSFELCAVSPPASPAVWLVRFGPSR